MRNISLKSGHSRPDLRRYGTFFLEDGLTAILGKECDHSVRPSGSLQSTFFRRSLRSLFYVSLKACSQLGTRVREARMMRPCTRVCARDEKK